MSYGNDRPPSLQEILNQPFEFQEVLLSPKERARVQKGLDSSYLFVPAGGEAGSGGLVVKEYRLREISVRLRTINNACDSLAALPDGTPISEVSLYGSRERQYLIGPYGSLKRLMTGDLPSSALQSRLSRIEALTKDVDKTIEMCQLILESNTPPHRATTHLGAYRYDAENAQHVEVIRALENAAMSMKERLASIRSSTHHAPMIWWQPWSEEAGKTGELLSSLRADLNTHTAAVRDVASSPRT